MNSNTMGTVAEHAAHEHGMLQAWIEQFYCFIFHLEEGEKMAEFLSHFTYDLLRTFVVFFVVLIIVSFLKTYISAAKVQYALLKVTRFGAIVLAALVGLFSSTCVCTNVPLFFGFLAFGVPLHLAMTFLISSSLINIASLVSMAALTDWRFTLCFVAASLFVTIVAGLMLSFLQGEHYIKAEIKADIKHAKETTTKKDRIGVSWHETKHTLHHQWIWILLGVLLSAMINTFVNLAFAQTISDLGFWGILLAALVGLVLHTDIISVIPVISAFLGLQISFGFLFSLVASLAFFSIPMMVMVKNTIRLRYLLYTWGIVFVLIVLAGTGMMPLTLAG